MTRTRAEHRLSLFVELEFGGTIYLETVVGALGLIGDPADNFVADLLAIGLARQSEPHQRFGLIVPEAHLDAFWQFLDRRNLSSELLMSAELMDAPERQLHVPRRSQKEYEQAQFEAAQRLLNSRDDLWLDDAGHEAVLMYRMTLLQLYELFSLQMDGDVGLTSSSFVRSAAEGSGNNRIAKLFNAARMHRVQSH